MCCIEIVYIPPIFLKGSNDYSLESSLFVASVSQNARALFTLLQDNIAAEGEETLELELTLLSTPTENAFFLNRLSIIIEDSDGESSD